MSAFKKAMAEKTFFPSRIIHSFLAFWLLSLNTIAQSESALERYIAIGLKNNEALIREQLESKIQSEVLREAKGKYLPNVFIDASYIRADGGRTILFPAGDLVNPIYGGLNQVIGSDVYPTNIPNVEEQFLPDDFHETKVRLIQPILNTDIYFNKRIQESKLMAQEAKKRAYENQLIKEIKVAYYRHLSARQQSSILEATRSILEELVRVSKSQVENEKATREVIYGAQAELNKLESQQASAERQEHTSGIFFNYLIGRELTKTIEGEPVELDVTGLTDDLETLTTSALNEREELRQIEYGAEASRAATMMNRRYFVPKINLVGDAGYQGFGYEFDDEQEFVFLRVGLTMPIFQGNQNRAKIQQASLREKVLESELKATNDLIALEVAEAYYALEAARKNLIARKAARKNAQENFRIIQKQYAQNQVIQVAFNDARNSFTTAQLLETIAHYNLKIRMAELESAAAYQNPKI